MTYSNHRILHYLCHIIVLPCFHTKIQLSFCPYTSSRTAHEPNNMHVDTDFVDSIESVMVNWKESEASVVALLM
jgi:hypothetical protein